MGEVVLRSYHYLSRFLCPIRVLVIVFCWSNLEVDLIQNPGILTDTMLCVKQSWLANQAHLPLEEDKTVLVEFWLVYK